MNCLTKAARSQVLPDLDRPAETYSCLNLLLCSFGKKKGPASAGEINAWSAFFADSQCNGAANCFAQQLMLEAAERAELPARVQWMEADAPLPFDEPADLAHELAALPIGQYRLIDLSVPQHHIEGLIARVDAGRYSLYIANTGGLSWIFHPSKWQESNRKMKRQCVLEICDISFESIVSFANSYLSTPMHMRKEQELYESYLPRLGGQRASHSEARFWSAPQVGGSCVGRAKLRLRKALLERHEYRKLKASLAMQGLRANCRTVNSVKELSLRAARVALDILHRVKRYGDLGAGSQRLERQLLDKMERHNTALIKQELERCGYADCTLRMQPCKDRSIQESLEGFTTQLLRRNYPEARQWMLQLYRLRALGQELTAEQQRALYQFLTGRFWPEHPTLDEIDLHCAGLMLLSASCEQTANYQFWDLDVFGRQTLHRYLQLSVYKYQEPTPWMQLALAEPHYFTQHRIFISPELESRIEWTPASPYPLPRSPDDRQSLLELALVWYRLSTGGYHVLGPHCGAWDSCGAMYLERLQLNEPLSAEEELALHKLVERVLRELDRYVKGAHFYISDCIMAYQVRALCQRVNLELSSEQQKLLDAGALMYQKRNYAFYFGE